ncbi:hypothetical protein FJT64_014212 [Amphibalanus amphitrite]|uniref:Uncharacterized protein n=1 Tax=Amphibalanus amphitrite TaxID=1232801 RepID=A0A6A4UUH8_AMPAM|nr:hypothetical protein FJT64_014212 [Amphibalanus amphitrite]
MDVGPSRRFSAVHLLQEDLLLPQPLCCTLLLCRVTNPHLLFKKLQESSLPRLVNSCFGWVVSGAVTDAQCSASLVSCRLLCLGDLRDTEVRNLWELEGVGISSKESESHAEDDAVFKQFESSVRFEGGRLFVTTEELAESDTGERETATGEPECSGERLPGRGSDTGQVAAPGEWVSWRRPAVE